MLPDQSGLELTRAVKRNKDTEDLPVIMLTARAEEQDKVVGSRGRRRRLRHQAVQPARAAGAHQGRAAAVDAGAAAAETIEAGGLMLDTASHRVTAGDQTVPLGPTEYRLLQFFMEHPERVYTRGQLLDRVWGGNVYVEERTVDVHIRRLRKALEPFALRRPGPDRARVRLPLLDPARVGGRRARSDLSQPAWQHHRLDRRDRCWSRRRSACCSVTRRCSSRSRWPCCSRCQVRNLLRFERWLRHRTVEPPPDMHGLWGEVAGDHATASTGARCSTSGAC